MKVVNAIVNLLQKILLLLTTTMNECLFLTWGAHKLPDGNISGRAHDLQNALLCLNSDSVNFERSILFAA